MNKNEFLDELSSRLNALPKEDKEERVSFYQEMIEDRVSEGKSEEEAVADLGGVDKVVDDIVQDTPLLGLVKERIKPKKSLSAWEIVLIILGFPLWFPLVTVFFVLCLVLYLLIWIGVLVVYAIELSLNVVSVYGIVVFFIFLFGGNFSMTFLGIALLGIGASVLLFFGCVGITKATCLLSRAIVRKIKSSFMKKGEAK